MEKAEKLEKGKLVRRGGRLVLVHPLLSRAARQLDLSTRGTPEERAARDLEEMAFWAPYRRRANALLDGPSPESAPSGD